MPQKRNNNCVHSEGLTFVITGAENRAEIRSRGILMLFKDELIISLRPSKVRRATGAPPPRRDAIKGLKVKELCWKREPPNRRVCFITAVCFASLESSSFGGYTRVAGRASCWRRPKEPKTDASEYPSCDAGPHSGGSRSAVFGRANASNSHGETAKLLADAPDRRPSGGITRQPRR